MNNLDKESLNSQPEKKGIKAKVQERYNKASLFVSEHKGEILIGVSFAGLLLKAFIELFSDTSVATTEIDCEREDSGRNDHYPLDTVWIDSEEKGDLVIVKWCDGHGNVNTETMTKQEFTAEPEQVHSFRTREIMPPVGCRQCEGEWPGCKYSCPLYDE